MNLKEKLDALGIHGSDFDKRIHLALDELLARRAWRDSTKAALEQTFAALDSVREVIKRMP